ncbi:MAG: hypothetical protein PHE55_19795 [Methylococcaceae bacterium]|nr:hypothetical protein [Methylococcaceae bacterium]
MAKNYYLPKDDSGKADRLDHFAAKLPQYATLLEISAADVTAVQADAANFRYDLQAQQRSQAYAQQWTAHKNLLRDGGVDSATPPPALILPTPAPAPVAPGVIPRFTALAARIKNHKKYTLAIGQDLGIIGAEQTIDPGAWKPVLGIKTEAGHPIVTWTKGDAEALEIWVDRGDGSGFVFLSIDLKPDYPDTHPLPTPGTSAVWRYRAIYRLNDAQVGQWSDVISVTVGG